MINCKNLNTTMMSDSTITIPDFFANQAVFITGALGFVGRALLEKLLRGCPTVAKIYVLVRGKRGKSGEERLQQTLDAELFQRVREKNPDLMIKVIPINGDVTLHDLGVSPEDSLKLRDEVSIVIHSAANVNFGAGLKNLLKANVEGTKTTIEWAKQLRNIKAFVYISTAFSNSDRLVIEENVYPTRINPHFAIKLYSELPEDLANSIIPQLQGDHKLEYSFSKHLAEGLVNESRFDIPVCIVRPAVVGAAYQEPFPGWIDDFVGFFAALRVGSKGLVRVGYTNEKGTLDVVPVDHVVNLTLAAAMSVGTAPKESQEVQVFNCSTSDRPYLDAVDKLQRAGQEFPPNKILWYPAATLVRNRLLFRILDFFLHYMLAVLADGVLAILGKKPTVGLVFTYTKMKKLVDFTLTLMGTDFQIDTKNTKALYRRLAPEDQDGFNFNNDGIDQNAYIRNGAYGFRRYAAGERDEDLPEARKNIKRYYWYYLGSWGVFFVVVALLIRLFV